MICCACWVADKGWAICCCCSKYIFWCCGPICFVFIVLTFEQVYYMVVAFECTVLNLSSCADLSTIEGLLLNDSRLLFSTTCGTADRPLRPCTVNRARIWVTVLNLRPCAVLSTNKGLFCNISKLLSSSTCDTATTPITPLTINLCKEYFVTSQC